MKSQNEKCYIGVDVSKKNLDVYVLPNGKYMQFKNDLKEIQKLSKKLASFYEPLVVMEATGGYEKAAAQCLHQSGVKVAVINPRSIRDFAKALGKLAKTDRIDVQVIALFAEKMQPQANVSCDENQQKLADLNARRRQLVDMITMEKNRLHKANKTSKKSIERILKTLEKELKTINESLEKMIQGNEDYAKKSHLLQSVKGVGSVTSAILISDLPELGQVTAKQISALAGVAPYNRDSGTLRGKRTVWGGRATVRTALYMTTLVATRYNPQIKSFYQRLCDAGKQKKVAIMACMHKLLIIMNAMLKQGQPWRSEVASIN